MARHCFPTGFQLQYCEIPAEDRCVFCVCSEKVDHILLCPFARTVWDVVKEHVQIKLSRGSFLDMKQWSFEFLDRVSPIQTNTMVVTVLASMGRKKRCQKQK
ncbi:hypothetical protein ACQ4PT_051943 [Festuca glaucescens]